MWFSINKNIFKLKKNYVKKHNYFDLSHLQPFLIFINWLSLLQNVCNNWYLITLLFPIILTSYICFFGISTGRCVAFGGYRFVDAYWHFHSFFFPLLKIKSNRNGHNHENSYDNSNDHAHSTAILLFHVTFNWLYRIFGKIFFFFYGYFLYNFLWRIITLFWYLFLDYLRFLSFLHIFHKCLSLYVEPYGFFKILC